MITTFKDFFIQYLQALFKIIDTIYAIRSSDSSVSIVKRYGMEDRGIGLRFPAKARDFSLLHSVQNGSGVHPVSYQRGAVGLFRRR
jgi:hypothetical protein